MEKIWSIQGKTSLQLLQQSTAGRELQARPACRGAREVSTRIKSHNRHIYCTATRLSTTCGALQKQFNVMGHIHCKMLIAHQSYHCLLSGNRQAVCIDGGHQQDLCLDSQFICELTIISSRIDWMFPTEALMLYFKG